MHIAFTCTIVATFYCIIKKTENRVTIILIIFCSIDTTLCSNAMCTARRILETKCFYFITHFTQCSSSRSTGQTGSYNNHFQLAFIGRIYQFT